VASTQLVMALSISADDERSEKMECHRKTFAPGYTSVATEFQILVELDSPIPVE
jgi:hypothetical protein